MKSNFKIPKDIYYTLPNKELLEKPITGNIIYNNKIINKNYNHYFYDDKECLEFIKDNFSYQIYLSYCQIIPGAYKADFWRLCILYVKGGIYIDLGFQFLCNIDEIIKNNELILAKDRNNSGIFNAFIACVSNHPFIKKCIDDLCYKINNFNKGECPLDFSGPLFIQSVLDKYEKSLEIKFYYHSNDGKSIIDENHNSIIMTKSGIRLHKSKYFNQKICNFRKEFVESLKNNIESYHYDILWNKNIVFYNIYYDSWNKTSKDYHIKNGILYCRLKDKKNRWIENQIFLKPFTKYCNIDGLITEN